MPRRRRRIAIEHQLCPQALHLLIAGHVAQFRQLLQLLEHSRREGIQLVHVRIFERVLELRAAHAVFHRQILHRLHEQRDAGHLGQLRLQAANHVAGTDLSLVERFQVDQNASAVQRRVGAVDSDERRKTLDRRILQNDLAPVAAARLAISWKETVCAASETP